MALLLVARGETARAQWHARRAQTVYEHRLLTSPGDALLRLRTADAALLLGQHARAVQLLRETAIAQRDPRLSAALAQALVASWDANVANSLRELKFDSRSELATERYRFTCTTLAGGKPLKWVEEACVYAPTFSL